MARMSLPQAFLGSRRRLTLAMLAGVLMVLVFAAIRAETGRSPATGASIRASACQGAQLRSGDDLQAALERHPEGAAFCFSAGTYRLSDPLRPKAGQRLVAQPGAVLSGARMVTGWERSGRIWSATGHLPTDPTAHGECLPGYDGCRYAEAVFYDDHQLWRVGKRDDVAPGRFYEDYRAGAIWVGDDPNGHIVEVARAEAAITGEVTGVHVDGFVIEKFANRAQRGAVHALGPAWQIQRNEIRLNHGHGINSRGARVLGNHLHHNGQLGIGGGGGNDQLVVGNEIDHNNTAGFSPLWEAGGGKWAMTEGLIVRGNKVHHNQGKGLWTDINNIRTTYESNIVYANTSHGIYHEISYEAVIRNNRISDNGHSQPLPGWGGAGIRVAASPDVEIYGNVLTGNENAIMLVQQRRTDSPSRYGAHELHDVNVHDNDMTMSRNATGMVNDTGDDSFYDRNNRFHGNTYRLKPPDGRFFAWDDSLWDRIAWTQRFGQDTTGRFVSP
jgi:parallel beta-helix repeat protein